MGKVYWKVDEYMLIKLYDFLKSKNVNVYFIGQHVGECKESYIVLKDAGINSLNGKAGTKYLDLIFFIPKNKYTSTEKYRKEIIGFVKEFGKLKYTGNETSIVTDDDKKAITFSITYKILLKLEG